MPRRYKKNLKKMPNVIEGGTKGRTNTYRSEAAIRKLLARYERLVWGTRGKWLGENGLQYSHIQYWKKLYLTEKKQRRKRGKK